MQVIGHLKTGVTPAQAVADLNSVGSWLEKAYPKDDRQMSFALGRPSLLGDQTAAPIQAFVAGLMGLATLILLAACANLGSLFAARAADRSRELALRLALGDYAAISLSERLAAVRQFSSLFGGESGCHRVWNRVAADASQRVSLWIRASGTGPPHQSV